MRSPSPPKQRRDGVGAPFPNERFEEENAMCDQMSKEIDDEMDDIYEIENTLIDNKSGFSKAELFSLPSLDEAMNRLNEKLNNLRAIQERDVHGWLKQKSDDCIKNLNDLFVPKCLRMTKKMCYNARRIGMSPLPMGPIGALLPRNCNENDVVRVLDHHIIRFDNSGNGATRILVDGNIHAVC